MKYTKEYPPQIGDIVFVIDEGICYKARIKYILESTVYCKNTVYRFSGKKIDEVEFIRPKRWYEFWA